MPALSHFHLRHYHKSASFHKTDSWHPKSVLVKTDATLEVLCHQCFKNQLRRHVCILSCGFGYHNTFGWKIPGKDKPISLSISTPEIHCQFVPLYVITDDLHNIIEVLQLSSSPPNTIFTHTKDIRPTMK